MLRIWGYGYWKQNSSADAVVRVVLISCRYLAVPRGGVSLYCCLHPTNSVNVLIGVKRQIAVVIIFQVYLDASSGSDIDLVNQDLLILVSNQNLL